MGDIKRIRKKYQTPMHPWNKDRIEAEKVYKRDFGLTNKKEIWKADSLLKGFKNQIKDLPSMSSENAEHQANLLRSRLLKYGLLKEDTPLGQVLGFDTDKILERRLQTIVFKKGLARTAKQARQFITHEHITVNGKTINAPGYLVLANDEPHIEFHTSSQLVNPSHPERVAPESTTEKKKQAKSSKKEEEQPEVVALSEKELTDE